MTTGPVTALVTIGDFSRMTYLTVKALRHYHDIGLLEPVAVDPQSGYRRYSTDQVAAGQTIRRFRELDMPTEEIRAVLDATDERERDALITLHLDRMQAQLARTQETVHALRDLLTGADPVVAVSGRRLETMRAVAIREEVRFDDAAAWCDEVYEALHRFAAAHDLVVLGSDGALYEGSFFEEGVGTVTAFVPVRRSTVDDVETAHDRVFPTSVPGFEAAVAVHHGSFDRLDRTYRALGTRVAELGIGAPGPMREHYLDDDTVEVCWPVTGPVAT